ncbi:MAG: hypothetical protein KME08_12030 [Aphanothece sp. CMT-3BRIN-NPC111]|jgi:sulfur relay (sulfurtransferase) DsrF/TusC family protein|nr:hypothetical protein [Aphanothece sp. CMT-3BRIN-NPC111]
MTQASLNEQQLAELDELLELARVAEQKLKEFSEESDKVAQKWQRKAEAKRAAAQT